MAELRSYSIQLKRHRVVRFWIDKVTGLLFNNGGLALPIQTVTASYTATESDYTVLADAAAGALTVTLPAVGNGQILNIKKVDASGNNVTIDGSGAETIDGAATIALTVQYESVRLHDSASGWNIL